MKRNTLLLILFCASIFASCQKEPLVKPTPAVEVKPAEPTAPTSAKSITIPAGFNWANSRNVNFFITMATNKYPNMLHLVTIYDGDPAEGKLLGKGSMTEQSQFKCTLFIPNPVTNLTIVCTAPDNTKTSQKWTLTETNLVNTKLATP